MSVIEMLFAMVFFFDLDLEEEDDFIMIEPNF